MKTIIKIILPTLLVSLIWIISANLVEEKKITEYTDDFISIVSIVSLLAYWIYLYIKQEWKK